MRLAGFAGPLCAPFASALDRLAWLIAILSQDRSGYRVPDVNSAALSTGLKEPTQDKLVDFPFRSPWNRAQSTNLPPGADRSNMTMGPEQGPAQMEPVLTIAGGPSP